MTRIPQFFFLIWLLFPVLNRGYNVQSEVEEGVIDLQELLINVQSSLKSFEQHQKELADRLDKLEERNNARLGKFEEKVNFVLDKFDKTAAEKFGQCENISASFDSFREQVNARLDELEIKLTKTVDPTKKPDVMRHCADVYEHVSQDSGIYTVQPLGSDPFRVYCDMTTDGGGWTVFQQRGDFDDAPEDNFYRGWQEYKDGFGSLLSEFWMGLSKISLMTKPENGYQELRVDMYDWEGSRIYPKYQNFTVEDETHDFRLRFDSYDGDRAIGLDHNNLNKFSTYDRDNDIHETLNCAKHERGAWWYGKCTFSNLNGLNLREKQASYGIYWNYWKGPFYSLRRTEMKFRPMDWICKRFNKH